MIYFREANEPVTSPQGSVQVRRWHLEYYEDGFTHSFPVGVAYVTELVGTGAQLQFVFVVDAWRGNGFAKELVKAAKQRWPNLTWTLAMGSAGAPLLKSAGLMVG